MIKTNGTHIMTNTAYRIFALLGNEKIPQVHNIGMMGVYMNQFPFDRNRRVRETLRLICAHAGSSPNADRTSPPHPTP